MSGFHLRKAVRFFLQQQGRQGGFHFLPSISNMSVNPACIQHGDKRLAGALQRTAVGTESPESALAHGGGFGGVRKQMRYLRVQAGLIAYLDGAVGVAQQVRQGKWCMCGPNSRGLANMTGSRMLCPPTGARLPPTKATVHNL